MLSFSLICYIAVSSIAAVHAFPVLVKSSSSLQGIASSLDTKTFDDITMLEMESDCHQQKSNSPDSSTNACKIFCAAMASVISNQLLLDLTSAMVGTDVAFVAKGLHTREPALEPRPPK